MEMSSYPPGVPCWIDLGSPDPDSSSTFYASLLGWTIGEVLPNLGGYRDCLLDGKPVAGIGPQANAPQRPRWLTYISVADADAAAAAVRDHGGQVVVPAHDIPGAGRRMVFVDPTGADLAVWQADGHIGAGVVNQPGALTWNELTTRMTEEAKDFYHRVFGWTLESMEMGPVDYTMFKVGDRFVAGMMPMDDSWPSDLPSHWMTYFAVSDTDAAVQHVVDLGGIVAVPPTDIAPGRFAVATDPHGAVFSLITPASTQL